MSFIKSRVETRDEYKELVQNIFTTVTPLVVNYVTLASSVFDTIPYTELPPVCILVLFALTPLHLHGIKKSNHLFITASQVLDMLIEEEENYLGGCIIFQDSVLCTQIDENIVKWLLYRTQRLVRATQYFFFQFY